MMTKIKVLWFTNNACSALELLDPANTRGGWLISLEKELSCHEGIELHVGFYFGSSLASFHHGETTFHPFFRGNKKNKFARYLSRILAGQNNDQEDIEKIKALVNQVQPDIVHVHGTEENFGLIQEFTRIPVVFSIQGLLNPYIEKYFSGIPFEIARRYESYVDKLSYRTARSSYKKMESAAERERRILQNARYIIGRTDWDKSITRLLAPKSVYFTGQEMLRPSFYIKTWHDSPPKGILKIITVSSDSLYKGFEMVVKTARLLKEHPGFEFIWMVAGLHKNSNCVKVIRKWLEADLETLGIRLLGNQTETQLADLLATSDIFCQVSHIENSPNSLCEAQLVGIPIIATDVGGTKSLVQHGVSGIMFQEGDPYSMAGEIIQASRNFQQCQSMAGTGRSNAIFRHNKSEMINQYVNIYKQIINKN
jgi:glycosyltransferase involved in cell wall biosynthesis